MKTGPGFFKPLTIAVGAGLATVLAGLSLIIALLGFGRLYYLSIFLGLSVFFCLSMVWFTFLRKDGFGKKAESVKFESQECYEQNSNIIPSSLYAKVDSGLIERAPVQAKPNKRLVELSPSHVLVWASIWLCLLSVGLYKLYLVP